MSSPENPLNIPPHIGSLLSRLHAQSLTQELTISSSSYRDTTPTAFDALMLDKFIALEEDKCHFVYQILRMIDARTVVEAGTSFGVSTIYLSLAVGENVRDGKVRDGKDAEGKGKGRVIATEKEGSKAIVARRHWEEAGEDVQGLIELREGDLLETLREGVEGVDLLLLDIWAPLALPTLKIVQPNLRRGAVVIADNTAIGRDRYADLLSYVHDKENGFRSLTVPYKGGLEVCVYLP
ncbi:S-adenosyl-L-methionine-dependent methyltransferase [Cadophora sp. MPI-SDFR-AT-0126]|nr:S-adenosyl-L-methionine-dependent methyltransferase [Leotiomycetes sp. MPI-SDFR-AT-0126]